MAVAIGKSYVFAEFRLEPEKRLLTRAGKPVRLAHRPFQVLLFLLENRDRIVSREELLEKFWEGRDVYDEALTKCVGVVRKALGEPHDKPRFIETRWAEGYRFISEVRNAECGLRIDSSDAAKFTFTATNGNGVTEIISPAPGATRKTAAVLLCAMCAVAVCAFAYLRFPRSSAKPAPRSSLAVLPLKNLTGNPQNEPFADGMTESLIGSLAKVEGLKVISRNSVFAFKGKDTDPREIGRKLNVAAILEGSVRASGDKIRVEVRLVNAETGEILWSGKDYDGALADPLATQDDIARSVATQLRLKLNPAAEQRPTTNAEAYQNYLKGRYFWRAKTPEGLEKARRFFTEAIRLDPRYALAYAGLADYYFSGIWYAKLPHAEAAAQGKAAVLKVLELDPNLPEAHDGRARVAEMEWDWPTAFREKERALELDPNNASVWQGYAFLLLNAGGRNDEAIAAIRRAQELDPLSANIGTDAGVVLTRAKRCDEAIAALRRALELDERYQDAYWNLGFAYEYQGAEHDAFAAFRESHRLAGVNAEQLQTYETAFARAGLNGYWRKVLESFLKDAGKPHYSYWIASLYAHLGDKEAALNWLEKAYAAREPLLGGLKSDAYFDTLRQDPRYADLLRRLGRQAEARI